MNAAPFSFFNLLGPTRRSWRLPRRSRRRHTQDTALNIRATHEFVVDLVDESIAEAMNQCAASLPYGESELTHAGLHAAPSSLIKPPRIAESPASLECVEWGTLQIGGNRVIIGLIKRLHLRDELFERKRSASIPTNFTSSAAWPHRTGIAPHAGSVRDDSAG